MDNRMYQVSTLQALALGYSEKLAKKDQILVNVL